MLKLIQSCLFVYCLGSVVMAEYLVLPNYHPAEKSASRQDFQTLASQLSYAGVAIIRQGQQYQIAISHSLVYNDGKIKMTDSGRQVIKRVSRFMDFFPSKKVSANVVRFRPINGEKRFTQVAQVLPIDRIRGLLINRMIYEETTQTRFIGESIELMVEDYDKIMKNNGLSYSLISFDLSHNY